MFCFSIYCIFTFNVHQVDVNICSIDFEETNCRWSRFPTEYISQAKKIKQKNLPRNILKTTVREEAMKNLQITNHGYVPFVVITITPWIVVKSILPFWSIWVHTLYFVVITITPWIADKSSLPFWSIWGHTLYFVVITITPWIVDKSSLPFWSIWVHTLYFVELVFPNL